MGAAAALVGIDGTCSAAPARLRLVVRDGNGVVIYNDVTTCGQGFGVGFSLAAGANLFFGLLEENDNATGIQYEITLMTLV